MAALNLADVHRRRNESTRVHRETMAKHRARVTQLLVDARGSAGHSLCVLGAGNANDVELTTLAQQFKRVVLVDLDTDALRKAVLQLALASRQNIETVGNLDLTGILAHLNTWQAEQGASQKLSDLVDTARNAQVPALGTFDVVASTCVLTQLIDSIYLCVSPTQPLRQELVFAVRNRHLQLMIELLAPQGTGLLFTDFVSSETVPDMANIADGEFPRAAVRWINERNFFTGANPYAIRDYLRDQLLTDTPFGAVEVLPAWQWDMGAKQLAVTAIRFGRQNAGSQVS